MSPLIFWHPTYTWTHWRSWGFAEEGDLSPAQSGGKVRVASAKFKAIARWRGSGRNIYPQIQNFPGQGKSRIFFWWRTSSLETVLQTMCLFIRRFRSANFLRSIHADAHMDWKICCRSSLADSIVWTLRRHLGFMCISCQRLLLGLADSPHLHSTCLTALKINSKYTDCKFGLCFFRVPRHVRTGYETQRQTVSPGRWRRKPWRTFKKALAWWLMVQRPIRTWSKGTACCSLFCKFNLYCFMHVSTQTKIEWPSNWLQRLHGFSTWQPEAAAFKTAVDGAQTPANWGPRVSSPEPVTWIAPQSQRSVEHEFFSWSRKGLFLLPSRHSRPRKGHELWQTVGSQKSRLVGRIFGQRKDVIARSFLDIMGRWQLDVLRRSFRATEQQGTPWEDECPKIVPKQGIKNDSHKGAFLEPLPPWPFLGFLLRSKRGEIMWRSCNVASSASEDHVAEQETGLVLSPPHPANPPTPRYIMYIERKTQ